MKKLVLAPKAAVAFLFLSAVLAASSPRPAGAAATDKVTQVEVVNTPTVNLPAGSTVGLAPGTSVTVGRSQGTAPVLPILARAQFSGSGGTVQNIFAVPPGQRLVIENVSGYFFTDGGAFVARITDENGSIEFLPASAQGPAGPIGEGLYVFNQTARIDIGAPNDFRQLRFELYAATSTFSGECVISGYIVQN